MKTNCHQNPRPLRLDDREETEQSRVNTYQTKINSEINIYPTITAKPSWLKASIKTQSRSREMWHHKSSAILRQQALATTTHSKYNKNYIQFYEDDIDLQAGNEWYIKELQENTNRWRMNKNCSRCGNGNSNKENTNWGILETKVKKKTPGTTEASNDNKI